MVDKYCVKLYTRQSSVMIDLFCFNSYLDLVGCVTSLCCFAASAQLHYSSKAVKKLFIAAKPQKT